MNLTNWLHLQRVLSLPYVTAQTMTRLPKQPGLYYVVADRHILYVGLAGEKRSTLYDRWLSYEPHKMQERVNSGARLHYKVIGNRKTLRYREALEIQRFNPPYNVQRPNPAQYRRVDWALIVYCLISAVFLYVMMRG